MLIPGATGQSYTPDIPGSYTVTVDNDLGCFVTSGSYGYKTGIASSPGEEEIFIYPNPVTTSLSIRTLADVYITISTLQGKLILDRYHGKTVYTGGLAAGVYLLRITDQAGRLNFTGRIIKVKE